MNESVVEDSQNYSKNKRKHSVIQLNDGTTSRESKNINTNSRDASPKAFLKSPIGKKQNK